MKFKIKLRIEHSPSEVFKLMNNTGSMMKWETNFGGFQPVKGAKRKVGSIANRIYNEPDGTTTKIKEETTEIRKNALISYQLTHKNFFTYVSCKFLDQGDGSTLLVEETNMQFRPRLLNVIGFMMKGSMRKQREADLKKFSRLLNQ